MHLFFHRAGGAHAGFEVLGPDLACAPCVAIFRAPTWGPMPQTCFCVPPAPGKHRCTFLPHGVKLVLGSRRTNVPFLSPAPQSQLDTIGETSAPVFPQCWCGTNTLLGLFSTEPARASCVDMVRVPTWGPTPQTCVAGKTPQVHFALSGPATTTAFFVACYSERA